MRTEPAIEVKMPAFGDQMIVEFADDRAECIGVVMLPAMIAGPESQPVARERRETWEASGKEPCTVDALKRAEAFAGFGIEHLRLVRTGDEGIDDRDAVDLVRAEHDERVAMTTFDDGANVVRMREFGGHRLNGTLASAEATLSRLRPRNQRQAIRARWSAATACGR
jgi:hypothetical protein